MFKNLTWPQVAMLAVCLAAPIVAFRLLGSPEAYAATAGVGTLVTFLLGRAAPDDKAPSAPPGAS